MQITKNAVVDFDYTLTDDDGKVIDSSDGQAPLSYLHGAGGIIPGLERELEGKQIGDELNVSISPADGYGERNEALCQKVDREQFAGEEISLGMQFRVDSDQGPMVITIVNIEESVVTIDGNHPLAGLNLNFEVTVRNIREATVEELDHGHVHGPGGHEH